MKNLIPILALFALASSCQASLPLGTHIGQDIEAQNVVALSVADASPGDYVNRTVLLDARVTAVCERAGCWMKIEDEGHTAMVRWEAGCGGEFVFPMSAVGQRVIIQGSFYPKVISEEDALHIEAEAADGVTIPRETYELNASAVLLYAD